MGPSANRTPAVIGAVVPAAGASERMGSSKPLLAFASRTLLDLALGALELAEIERTVVVLGANANAIQAAVHLDDVELVENPAWRDGMLTSVQRGLAALAHSCTHVVILPCDYGLVGRATVARLLLRSLLAPDVPLLAPSFQGRSGHPILLGRETFAAVAAAPTEYGLDRALLPFRERRALVEVNDPAVHFDIDTPDDYRRALAAWQTREESFAQYRDMLTPG